MRRFLILLAWLPASFIVAIPFSVLMVWLFQHTGEDALRDALLRNASYVFGVASGWYAFCGNTE